MEGTRTPLRRDARRADGRGRPWRSSREVLDGILWILRTEPSGLIFQSGTRRSGPATAASSVRDVLAAGLATNPPPQARRRPCQRGRLAQSPARNLLERLTLGQEQVLAFLDELSIPFDNNQAGRDLRGFKVQQKVSGCFPSNAEAEAFASLRGYLATLRKQGQALLAALETVFAGQPPLSCVRLTYYLWCTQLATTVGNDH